MIDHDERVSFETKGNLNLKRIDYLTLVSWVVLGERALPFVVFYPFVALNYFVMQVASPQPRLLMTPNGVTEEWC